jgi:hypothetical protein
MADARRAYLALIAALFALALPARAQLEGALMPGKVVAGHAKLETECRNCHVPFDKRAQDRLCLDCHKPVALDVARGAGYHGRIRPQPCRACHTEHKGRAMNIAAFDTGHFDHAQTDFALREAHRRTECKACHRAGTKFRDAPHECVACHRKDDKHKGALGPACADCHSEARWKDVRFDHARTRFPLLDKHAKATCVACHKTPDFKGTPTACVSCHRKDDKHKGRFGPKCESCHGAADWKSTTFDHDRDTHFALRFKHRTARCEACHTGFLFRDKAETACASCHRKDDKHKGTLGARCGDCHDEQSWTRAKFDHAKTRFPLAGKHADAKCGLCHRNSTSFHDTPLDCLSCHRKDDKHKGRFGAKCETCHGDATWKRLRFVHDRDTKYPLRGAHRTTRCELCHVADLYRDKAPTECIGCHRKDDKHAGQLGRDCAACHVEDDWKRVASFDHDRTRFPLLGRHAGLDCRKCHATPAFKDAKSDCYSCHRKDDRHHGGLGAKCDSCHNARDWRAWDFNHGRRTRFALDGGHARIACEACHRPGAPGAPRLAMACGSCHEKDDVHEGRFGRACERCHETTKFSRIRPGMGRGVLP